MGEERALIGAAFLVALVAATVSATCVVYPDVMTRRGLLAVMDRADPVAATVLVTSDVAPSSAEAVDAEVSQVMGEALRAGSPVLVRTARSESWQLPGGDGLEHPPLTFLAWDQGLDARTSLVAGTWAGPGSAGQAEAVVTTRAAAGLGVGPGSVLEIASRQDPARRLAVRISGIVEVSDPADPAWGGDRLVLDGAVQPGSFPLRGPLFVSREALLQHADTGATLGWRALLAFERLAPDDVGSLRAGAAGLEASLEARLGTSGPSTVTTSLPDILDAAGAGILAGQSGTVIIALQLLVMAAYALVLLASLVVDQRRATTELEAARGARAASLLGVAALEGVLIAVPAVLLGLMLAVPLTALLAEAHGGAAAPVPRLTTTAVLLALAAGAVAVGAMALPTLASLGPVTRLRGAVAARGTRGLAERTGIDIALLVLTCLALWQLRENGTPIARAAGGGRAVDPLLAVAPAIGLLAGGFLALRAGPLIGSWLERPAGGIPGAVPSLATRGIARRSLDVGRAAFLLVVATGIILFSASYARTWEQSQRDQIAAALPAELVGRAATGPEAPAPWVMQETLLAIAGVSEAIPAVRESFEIGNLVPRGTLVAAPVAPASSLMEVREDLADAPIDELLGRLGTGRPMPVTLELPAQTTALRIALDAALTAAPGADGTVRPIPSAWTGLGVSAVVQDGRGLIHRLAGATGRLAGGPQELEVRLAAPSEAEVALLPAPVSIVAVELGITLPEHVAATGSLRLARVTAVAGEGADGLTTTDVDLGPARATWGAVQGSFGVPLTSIPASQADPLAVLLEEPVTGPVPLAIAWRSADLGGLSGAPIPALVDGATRDAVGLVVGDVVPVQRGISSVLHLRVAGVVDLLPGIASGPGGVLVDLPTLALVDYGRDGVIAAPAEWWLGTAPGTGDPSKLAEAAGSAGLLDVRVRSAAAQDRLDDPLALGTRGALGLAAIAAILFGIIGFAAAAWRSVRTRRPELAVARALGVGSRQATAWLALELGFQLAIGICGGILLGMALAWAVLPSVSLTPDGTLAMPVPVIVVPWDLLALVILAGVVVLVAMLLPLRRLGRGATLARDLRETGS
jgi:hypothetical protein